MRLAHGDEMKRVKTTYLLSVEPCDVLLRDGLAELSGNHINEVFGRDAGAINWDTIKNLETAGRWVFCVARNNIRRNIVGYICLVITDDFFDNGNKIALLQAIYVVPRERGSYVSRLLVEYSINGLRKLDVKRVKCAVASKKVANLFAKFGFSKSETVMELKL